MTDTRLMTAACRCDCGYSCGRKCGVPIMSCIEAHYRRNCDHVFNGAPVDYKCGELYVSSATCSRCGLDAAAHDLAVGP